jgi:Probable zinc-ribbon domain
MIRARLRRRQTARRSTPFPWRGRLAGTSIPAHEMKSGKQRRTELKARRAARRAQAAPRPAHREPSRLVPVNEEALAPYSSYGAPDFVTRGYYVDRPFKCAGCGVDEIWTGTQQKWWYEVAKGYVYSGAKLCRACRRRERDHRAEARRVHLEGLARRKRRR